jgi:hypothetical protein
MHDVRCTQNFFYDERIPTLMLRRRNIIPWVLLGSAALVVGNLPKEIAGRYCGSSYAPPVRHFGIETNPAQYRLRLSTCYSWYSHAYEPCENGTVKEFVFSGTDAQALSRAARKGYYRIGVDPADALRDQIAVRGQNILE